MFKWLRKFINPHDDVVYLETDFCKGKSNQELLSKINAGNISLHSGMMIVNELLRRMVEHMEKKDG